MASYNRADLYVIVSWKEAQKLLPIFQRLKKHEWREVRESAARLYEELKDVRNQEYEPLGGKQIFLKGRDYEFMQDALNQMEVD